MGPEHESDPLVSRRDDELAGDTGAGEQPGASGDPIGEPRDSDSAPAEPREDVAEPGRGVDRPATRSRRRAQSPNMLPTRKARGYLERTFVRVVATGGIVGICVAIAAIMSSSNSQGWLIGLVVSLVSVVLAALLWSSRVL
jgi:hypothetical protein